MMPEDKKILQEFNAFLTDCWKGNQIDESSNDYASIQKKIKENDPETIMALKIGAMQATSYIQDYYVKEVIEKIE